MIGILRNLIGEEKVGKIFNKQVTAKSAYMMTTYMSVLSIDELMKKIFRDIDDQIKSKSSAGRYSLVIDINDQIEPIYDKVLSNYENLGFQVTYLDSKLIKGLEGKYILINWRSKSNLININNEGKLQQQSETEESH